MSLPRISIAFFALVCLFCACRKEDYPYTGDKVLKRMVGDNDSLLSTTFNYDANNHLIEIINSSRMGYMRNTSIEYNTAGNPMKFFSHLHWQPATSDEIIIDSLVYENGRVIKKLQRFPLSGTPNDFNVTHNYAYDGKGRLITDFNGPSNKIDELNGYTSFSYDADDNITEIREFRRGFNGIDSNSHIKVTYNSDKSPFNSLGQAVYFIGGNSLSLCKLNKAKVVYFYRDFEQFTDTYYYEYDSDRLPTKIITKRSVAGQQKGVDTFNLFYQ